MAAHNLAKEHRHTSTTSLILTLLLAGNLVDGVSAAAISDGLPRAAPTAQPTGAAAPGSFPEAAPLTTVPYRSLNVVPWPLPTAFADEQGRISQRQWSRQLRQLGGAPLPRQNDNTICGYIGGNPDLPATCSAGSHCVLDAEHGAVGCCPNGVDSCTAGVFTGCVDGGSDATDVNPYVYTCGGGSFCYKNNFPGGYYQYGCGSASTLGQSVAATASGMSALTITSQRITFTGTFTDTTSTSKTTKSSSTKSSSTKTKSSSTSSFSSSSTSSSSLSSTTLSSSSSTTSSSATHTPTGAASSSTDPGSEVDTGVNSGDRAGVIIGATISAVAGLIALIALAVYFCWKKRRGGGGTYTSRRGPLNFRSGSGRFQALHNTPDDFESGLRNPEMAMGPGATGAYKQMSAFEAPLPLPPSDGNDNLLNPGGGDGGGNGGNNDGTGDAAGAAGAVGSAGATDASAHDDDLWATPAVGPAALAAVASSSSHTPNRRSSASVSSLLSRDMSRRSSYRGVVPTTGPGTPVIGSVSGSIVSRVASRAATYNQISQQSPYYDANGNAPPQLHQPQNAYGNMNSNYVPTHPDDMLIDHDRVPLNREFDEFTRGYQDVLSRIGEEDPSELSHSGSAANLTGADNVTNSKPAQTKAGTNDSLSSRSIKIVNSSNSLGAERDSSSALPANHETSFGNMSNLNLRGGGSSGIASTDSQSSVRDSTTSNSTKSLDKGNPGSVTGSVNAKYRSSTNSGHNEQLSLNMTSPSLSLDGPLLGVGGVSPPAATLAAGVEGTTKTLSPPDSPPMRPLWQQNRQKSRNLMWS
ncbi:uncharacterized protein SPSK_04987 [Sporothrix schenckii 1099-18]|uniref:Uncharacterized protein n=1 Tax=Sporothrix schenckii 1099-18 TaxID=1397361 RepID=A0A0F2LWG2_SPOSC|nr:uncharacterized protein SPSK_04987 [Sporothrix schenckii 1099-18]KJR80236.1 hypothetical protein SPSK_04987 [Sporothrix schenckii 1099-18]